MYAHKKNVLRLDEDKKDKHLFLNQYLLQKKQKYLNCVYLEKYVYKKKQILHSQIMKQIFVGVKACIFLQLMLYIISDIKYGWCSRKTTATEMLILLEFWY